MLSLLSPVSAKLPLRVSISVVEVASISMSSPCVTSTVPRADEHSVRMASAVFCRCIVSFCQAAKIKVGEDRLVPLGVRRVSGRGLLVSALLVVRSLLVTVSVSGPALLSEGTEEGQQEGAEDEDEETDDDGVLDGGGVEGQGGGAVSAHGDEAQAGVALLLQLDVVGGVGAGQEGQGNNGVQPLHCVGCGVCGDGVLSEWGERERKERCVNRAVKIQVPEKLLNEIVRYFDVPAT